MKSPIVEMSFVAELEVSDDLICEAVVIGGNVTDVVVVMGFVTSDGKFSLSSVFGTKNYN